MNNTFVKALIVCLVSATVLCTPGTTLFAEEPEAESAAEPTLIDGWREILMFGLDNEVIELLTVLRDQRERRLFAEVSELLAQTTNPRLQQRIFEFFASMEYGGGEEAARAVIVSHRDVPVDLLLAAIRYISAAIERPSPETMAALHVVAEGTQVAAAEAAIRTIGRRGSDDDIEPLLERLLDQRSAAPVRNAVILALGELEAVDAVDELLRIASDTVEESTTRQFAADSLGRIGDERAVEVLIELAVGSDTMLRAYAVNALGSFEGDQVERIVLNALRDSFWRVRVAALEAVARHDLSAAIPAVQFRAQRDPEMRVRTEAIATLARLSDRSARTFLEEMILEQRNPEATRVTALLRLTESDLSGSEALLRRIIDAEYDRPQSRMLDQVGRIISTSDEAVSSEIYERFLHHPNFLMQLYGVRAAGRHGIGGMRDRLTEMRDAPFHQSVRRAAADALDR